MTMQHKFENLMIEVAPGCLAGCYDGIAHIVRETPYGDDWCVDRIELLCRDEDGEPVFVELGYEQRYLHDWIEAALPAHDGPSIERKLARRALLSRWLDFPKFMRLAS